MSANRDSLMSLLLDADLPTVTVSPWDEKCSDQHLYQISQLIAEWREIAPALGLTETDEENIVGQAPFSVPAQRTAMLRMWKRKNGAASTYRKLADVLSKCDRQNLVDEIGKLVDISTSVISGATETDNRSSIAHHHHCLPVHASLTSTIPSPAGESLPSASSSSNFTNLPSQSSSCSQSKRSRQFSSNSPPPSQHPRLDGAPSYSSSFAAPCSQGFSSLPVTALSTGNTGQHTPMQQYVKYLKNVYISKRTPVYDKESTLLQVKAKQFINIALVNKDSGRYMYVADNDKNEMIMDRLHGHVDAIQKKKTKLQFCDVSKCEDGSVAQCVLVEGAPGVGKTTFVFELGKRWACGEVLQDWTLLVIIKLRDRSTRTAQSLHDLLYHPDRGVWHAVVQQLINEHGEHVLLILDGYDELTDKQRQDDSVVQRLMSRQLLCRATLMVTSRPIATRTLHPNFHQSIDQHIEVLGFTDKNIEEYIKSACGDKPELVEDFKSYLSSHPFSSSLMFNPLQCAIVTDLYRSHWELGNKGFAPKTLTELYTGLIHIMLWRYLTHHPVHKDRDWLIRDINDLPEEVKQQFRAVTELAAEGIENQQYVFDETDGNVPSETLGLMQREEEVILGSGRSVSHNFLHLTLQEYLAAVNYSQQCSNPEQLLELLSRNDLFPLDSFLKNYGKRRKHDIFSSATHWPVVLFVAGKTKLRGVSPSLLSSGIRDSKADIEVAEVDVSLLHLLYETQCPQLIRSTLVTSRKYLSVYGRSALDWFVIGCCITNSNSKWKVVEIGCDSAKHMDQLIMGLGLACQGSTTGGEGVIEHLYIERFQLENLKILSKLQPYAKSLTKMKLICVNQKGHDPNISQRESDLSITCSFPMLQELTVQNAISTVSVSVSMFISQQKNLHYLLLLNCSLTIGIFSSVYQFLLSQSQLKYELVVKNCRLFNYMYAISLTNFHLKFCRLDSGKFSLKITGSSHTVNEVMSALRSYLESVSVLTVHLDKDSPLRLQIKTSDYPMLEKLDIESNYMDNHCAFDFSLQQNNLHTLALSKCRLSTTDGRSFFRSLQLSCCRLHKVTLNNCFICATHINPIAISCQLYDAKFYLDITGSCSGINYMMSQHFNTQTLTVLRVHVSDTIRQIQLATSDTQILTAFLSDTIGRIQLATFAYPMLKVLHIDSNQRNVSLSPSVFYFGSQQNNLHTLSLKNCKLSHDAVTSLIFSLQSPHCRLSKLTLDKCIVGDFYYLGFIHDFFQLEVDLSDSDKLYLKIASSCCTESKPQLYAKTMTGLSTHTFQRIRKDVFHVLSFPEEDDVQRISFSVLDILKQVCSLQTLSLRHYKFTSEFTSSLVHFLQSPHCRLSKLTMYWTSTVSSTDTYHLTMAAVTSTTIAHLLLVYFDSDNSPLTALANGLGPNRMIKELVFDYELGFSEDQFRMLIKAVDSSSVKKLWLNNCVSVYKEWMGSFPFSRNDVEIVWYNYADLMRDWFNDEEENTSSDDETSLQHLQQ